MQLATNTSQAIPDPLPVTISEKAISDLAMLWLGYVDDTRMLCLHAFQVPSIPFDYLLAVMNLFASSSGCCCWM